MPRRARRWEPGAIHHIDARAHDGDPIFAMDDDRRFVVERAARIFREEGVTCFAWAVLSNHYHMLARFPGPPKRPMQRLNTAIARRVRRLQGGKGPVFQDRFFGDPCRGRASILRRVGYVTANPIHHRVVATVELLEHYPWSSMGEVTGRRPAVLADPDATRELVEAAPGRARAAMFELLELRVRAWDEEDAALPSPRHPDIDAPIDPEPPQPSSAAASGPEPTDWELAAARRARLRAVGWTPARLIDPVCASLRVRPQDVASGDRSHAVSRARAVVAHVACDHIDWPTGEVAAAVGVSVGAVLRARRRGGVILSDSGLTSAALLRRAGAGSKG